jgi:hypothetical protein
MGNSRLKGKTLPQLALLLLLLYSNLVRTQEYSHLSEVEKWELRLHSQAVIDIDSISVVDLPGLSTKKSQLAVYIGKYRSGQNNLLRQISENVDRILILGDTKIPEGILKPQSVLYIPFDVLESRELLLKDGEGSQQWNSKTELLRVLPGAYGAYTDSILIGLWDRLGRMPHFIQVPPSRLGMADSLVAGLNSQARVYGSIRSKDGPLYGVGLKNQREARVNGYFSFPVLDQENLPILIPHKAGYYFSPDIIYTTPENIDNSKEFMGFPLAIEYGLTDHFVFRKSIENTVRKNNKELISNNMEVHDDPLYGNTGYFNGKAYIDAGLNSRTSLQGSFSITAWVRPTALDSNNSILGKGDNFVLKLHNGSLTFTMADVKDYVSQASPVPIRQWTQVALVHSSVNNELFFFINGEQTDRIGLIAQYEVSNYNILIGSNLWQEFFKGHIADIKIWDRELNPMEIQQEYQKMGKRKNAYPIQLLKWAGLLLLFLVCYLLYRYLKRRKKKTTQTMGRVYRPSSGPDVPIAPNGLQEQIRCFGTLRIFNAAGEDIAKKLSPKLRQLFVLVLLHSVNGKKGITTVALSELLWPGMGAMGAKNTRGTSIQNLRGVLSSCPGIDMVFRDKCWFLQRSENCYCDYEHVLQLLGYLDVGRLSPQDIRERLPELLDILKKGRFLSTINTSWLDPYVEHLSNQIIELCSLVSKKLDLDIDKALLYDLATVVYLYDDLNENALRIKLRILIGEGKYSLARSAYDSFSKLYGQLYAEPYLPKFEEIILEKEL